MDTTEKKRIKGAFVRELESFRRGGYRFDGSKKELFEGTQREAFDAYLDGIKHDQLEGYFEIPTGVGKTALFIAIIGCYLRATENMPDAPRILIHEPSNDLVVQTALAFADFMPEIAKTLEADDDRGRMLDWKNSDLELHYGKRHGAKNDHRVLVTTYQSQASDERKVERTTSLNYQVKKLCTFIASDRFTQEQRAQACRAIGTALGAHLKKGVTPEFIRQDHKMLSAAIEKCHSRDPELRDFLRDVRDLLDLPADNPLVAYRTATARDREAAVEGRTFKPEDFGLVIHDEAHYLTGPKYGPAAVDKFRGGIQLGVTATPEYSEDKTVANMLGHRYYHLPLNTAIERGDLCHVRPMLQKTNLRGNDRINLERARQFLEERHGQPLTGRQLEQLLNQEARNKAILKGYLTGKHPDTEERFLGQTGQIFAGGITHCSDFIRDANKLLDQPAYRPIRRWLRDEGLALIAPIHSNLPKEGAEINLGGKRRVCTKEEIKELHRRGKILLIISDQELKLGSDYPMDSYIADAVDRFSVPDATQRVGRGFRLDRPNPRYDHPGNPNKSCVVVNVIDEATHEMYRGTPHHPIHALEILHGAEHRPPMPRKGAITRFARQPPEVSESLQQLGFEFITRTEALRAVAKKFEDGKKKQELPDKDDKWLTSDETTTIPGGSRLSVQAVVKAVIWAYDSERLGIQQIPCNGQIIRVQKLQSRGGRQPVCIYREDWPKVERAADVAPKRALPEKDDEWLSLVEGSSLPGGRRVALQKTAKEIAEAYNSEELGLQEISCNGQMIRVQRMQSGSQQPVCIFREDWPKVELAAGVSGAMSLPVKDENWLSVLESRRLPGAERTKIKVAVKAITEGYDVSRRGVQQIHYNGQVIRVQKMKSGVQQPICIYREDWPRVELAAEETAWTTLPEKDGEWVTLSEARNLPGGGRGRIMETAKAIIDKYEGKKLGVQILHHHGHDIRAQKMQTGTLQVVCIYREDWPEVESAAGVASIAELPAKDDKWVALNELSRFSGGQRVDVVAAAKAVVAAYDPERAGPQNVRHNGQTIRVQKVNSKGQQPVCIHREDWPKVELAAGLTPGVVLPKKGDDWLSARDIRAIPGAYRANIEKAVKAITSKYDMELSGIQEITHNEQTVRLQNMQSGPARTVCIYRDDWPKVELAADLEPRSADANLKSKRIAPKDLTPGGSDLKRSGRARGTGVGQE